MHAGAGDAGVPRRRSSVRRASRCSRSPPRCRSRSRRRHPAHASTGCPVARLICPEQRAFEVPRMFWPLAAYAVATLIASVFSVDPRVSASSTRKQLVLLLIVPIAYRLFRGRRALHGRRRHHHRRRDQRDVGHRPVPASSSHDHLGPAAAGHARAVHDVLGAADAGHVRGGRRALCSRTHHRAWAALVMPALVLALAFTFTPQCLGRRLRGIGLLLLIRDFRLIALLPVVAGACSSRWHPRRSPIASTPRSASTPSATTAPRPSQPPVQSRPARDDPSPGCTSSRTTR